MEDYSNLSGIAEAINYGEWNTTSDCMLVILLVCGIVYLILRLLVWGALIYYIIKIIKSFRWNNL